MKLTVKNIESIAKFLCSAGLGGPEAARQQCWAWDLTQNALCDTVREEAQGFPPSAHLYFLGVWAGPNPIE